MADNVALTRRLAACAAQQKKTKPYEAWVSEHRWDIAATPGWAAKWESALAADPDSDPGANEACITDQDILSAVQPMQ